MQILYNLERIKQYWLTKGLNLWEILDSGELIEAYKKQISVAMRVIKFWPNIYQILSQVIFWNDLNKKDLQKRKHWL